MIYYQTTLSYTPKCTKEKGVTQHKQETHGQLNQQFLALIKVLQNYVKIIIHYIPTLLFQKQAMKIYLQ